MNILMLNYCRIFMNLNFKFFFFIVKYYVVGGGILKDTNIKEELLLKIKMKINKEMLKNNIISIEEFKLMNELLLEGKHEYIKN